MSMINRFKALLYFPVAYYFKFFAQIQLSLWKPRIIVVTGSSGKTTLLNLIESQIKDRAKYSHGANSSYGVPFDILGIQRRDLFKREWIGVFLSAPFRAFKKPFNEKLYIVEADCDRPGEGKFLASFLKPNVTLWVSSSRTHSMNFDELVRNKKFGTVEEAVAYEFGYFIQYATDSVIVNGDSRLMNNQLKRSKAVNKLIKKDGQLDSYKITSGVTNFVIGGKQYQLSGLFPEQVFYSIAMTNALLDYLKMGSDRSFIGYQFPPGRSSVFKGIKGTTIVDSSYNANLDSMNAMIGMFDQYPAKTKWVVLGDMLEQGEGEKEEHEKLAKLIVSVDLSRIILMGPRVSAYTYPILKELVKDVPIEKFTSPKEVLDYLQKNIQGGETILFKGARFLEGVIEHLLLDKKDAEKLCRREKIWQIRRSNWGL